MELKILKYSFEDIWNIDAGYMTADADTDLHKEFRVLVTKALSMLPVDIVDDVMSECLFIMPRIDFESGYYIPKEQIDNRFVLVFPEELLKKDEDFIIRKILHEIAHWYLKHNEIVSYERNLEKEKETDNQVDQWV
jgi:hypothetical protein